MKRIVLTFSCFAILILPAIGQTPSSFEVASVKLAAPAPEGPKLPAAIMERMGFSGGPGSKTPNRINYSGVTLKSLLARAYEINAPNISGPGWLETERYDVVAKLPPGTDAEGLRAMLQGLLLERFQITLHRELQMRPMYELTVAKNGPKLQAAEPVPEYKDEAERTAATRKMASDRMTAMMNSPTHGPRRNFHLSRATTAEFAHTLSSHLPYPVTDLTHLDGVYSFSLGWVPDSGPEVVNDTPSGPSIYTAIQEQLGLKLQLRKEQSEVLVIDKAEKSPTSN